MMDLVYCDYIAACIGQGLDQALLEDDIITEVKGPFLDLHPTEGYFQSTRKTMMVTDKNGRQYRITVEEIEH